MARTLPRAQAKAAPASSVAESGTGVGAGTRHALGVSTVLPAGPAAVAPRSPTTAAADAEKGTGLP
ncbi:hypothetical protein ACWDG1_06360 [Streptomyces sp. NPDC001177]